MTKQVTHEHPAEHPAQARRLSTLFASAAVAVALTGALVGCSALPSTVQTDATNSQATSQTSEGAAQDTAQGATSADDQNSGSSDSAGAQDNTGGQGGMAGMGGMGGMDTQPGETTDKGYTANDNGLAITTTLNPDEAFTERDLQQEADTSNAQNLTLTDGQDLTISAEGVYVVTGSASEASIIVDAPDTAKVQIVLDGVTLTNTDAPAVYVKSADKVFVTLVSENTLATTGAFTADGDTNTDAVIFSKNDLCLNGTGSLTITSSANGITSKDDLKITGGTYTITCEGDGLEANDSIRIAAGTLTVDAQGNAIQCKNDDDNELGYVYIKDGTFKLTAADDGIQGNAFVWIDGGTFDLNAAECIEGTYIQINGGTFTIKASDDAINASIKSSIYTPTLEITGGELTIEMASGDTDALDSNGYLYLKGGKLNITAQSAFDYAWGGELTGSEVYVNGTQVTELTQMMGPGGGMGGGMNGNKGGGQMPQGQPPQDGQMPQGKPPQDGQMPQGKPPQDGQMPQGQSASGTTA